MLNVTNTYKLNPPEKYDYKLKALTCQRMGESFLSTGFLLVVKVMYKSPYHRMMTTKIHKHSRIDAEFVERDDFAIFISS